MARLWGEAFLQGCTCHSPEMGQAPPGGSAGSFRQFYLFSTCIRVHPSLSQRARHRRTYGSRALLVPARPLPATRDQRKSEPAQRGQPCWFPAILLLSLTKLLPRPIPWLLGRALQVLFPHHALVLWGFQTWQCKSIPYTGLLISFITKHLRLHPVS